MPGTVLGVVVTAVRKTHIVVELAFRERIPSLGGQCQTQGGSLSVFDERMGGGSTCSHRQSWKDPEVPVLFTSHFWACVPGGAVPGLWCEDGLDTHPALEGSPLGRRWSKGRGGSGPGRDCCAEHRSRRGMQTLILEMMMITDTD